MAELHFLTPAAAPPSGIRAVFLGRRGGISPPPYDDLNVSSRVGDTEANVAENLARVGEAFAAPGREIALLHQIHGNRIAAIKSSSSGNGVAEPEADGWISDQAGSLFGIRTADCAPVLAWDVIKGIVGAAHAGWRGTRARVAAELIRSFVKDFGSRPGDIHCVVGPAIGPCCYEVGPDLIANLGTEGLRFLDRSGPRPYLDLPGWNRHQLVASGLDPAAVEVKGVCTACHPTDYFSNRRDGARTGRQLSFIGLL